VALAVTLALTSFSLAKCRHELVNAEQKIGFLLMVMRQDGYEVEAPHGVKGTIRVPSHSEIKERRLEGKVKEPN
jgi:hypothetical protein